MNVIAETERLYLRELSPGDAKDLSLVLCDAESMKYYPGAFTAAEVEAWIAKNVSRYGIYGYGLWGVVLKENGRLIGDCGITIQNIDNEFLPEIGFHVVREHCRKGYATEAGRKVLAYCNGEYKIRRVYSYCDADNVPSRNTMKKIGMEYHKSYYRDGTEKSVYVKRFP
jgi:RimJ/RimL family protein N-acetyltransferase